MREFHHKFSRRGLTILETGIAAVIFAIAAVALAGLFSNAQESSARATKRLAATTLATRYIEEAVETARFGGTPTADSGTFLVRTVRRGNESQASFQWQRTVTALANGVQDVVVTVTWEWASQPQSVVREVLVFPTS